VVKLKSVTIWRHLAVLSALCLGAALLTAPPAAAAAVTGRGTNTGHARALPGVAARRHAVPAVPRQVSAPRPRPASWPAGSSTVYAIDTHGRAARATQSATTSPITVTGGPSPAGVRVDVLDHATATTAGVNGLLFQLTATPASTAGHVTAVIDTSGFGHAFGAGYRSRLHVVEYPACLLTSRSGCATPRVLPSTLDDATGQITAQLDVDPAAATADALPRRRQTSTQSGGGHVFALIATTSSAASGNWSASQIKDSDTWNVGTNTGDFSYDYPIAVPHSPGGLDPSVALSYDSQSVDGRTSGKNMQASPAGMGWDYAPGSITREYRTCNDDYLDGRPDGHEKWGDACYQGGGDNATLSLGGASGELILDQTTGKWQLKNDNGWTVQQLTGAANDDTNGTYWVVTTTSGVRYFFGLGHAPAPGSASVATNSVQVRPVIYYPCPPVGTLSGWSYCYAGYKWNLDYVVDPHGNEITYLYHRTGNAYGAGGGQTTLGYTADDYVSDIWYGASTSQGSAPLETGHVVFSYGRRCFNGTPTLPGQCPTPTAGNGWAYPDAPVDLQCASSCTAWSPTFFSSQLLTGITAYVSDTSSSGTGGWRETDAYDFTYSFLTTSDSTDAALWLRDATHWIVPPTGSGETYDDRTVFYGTALANRADNTGTGGARPTMNLYRLSRIIDPLGGDLTVNYGQPDPCNLAALGQNTTTGSTAYSDQNVYDCFPQYVGPDASGWSGTSWGWFNKYLVTSTTDTDDTGSTPAAYTWWVYGPGAQLGNWNTGGAWHYTNDPVALSNTRSWTQWRGYRNVTVYHSTIGLPINHSDSYVFYRGMDGDRTASGAKSVSFGTSFAGNPYLPGPDTVTDDWQYNGRLHGHTVNLAGGGQVSADWHNYQKNPGSRAVSTDVHNRASVMAEPLWDVTLGQNGKYAYTKYDYDNLGQVRALYRHDGANQPYRCTLQYYARNGSATPGDPTWQLPSRREDWHGDCYSGWEDGWAVTLYDGNTDTTGWDETNNLGRLSRGDATSQVHFVSSSAAFSTSTGYDGYGRPVSHKDGNGVTTTIGYGLPWSNPTTITTTTAPAGLTAQTTSVAIDPGHGSVMSSTDANGHTTTRAYDIYDRLASVTLPGASSPQVKYAYTLPGMAADGTISGRTRIETDTLQADGSYLPSFTYDDGFGQPVQIQTPAPGGGFTAAYTGYDAFGHPTVVTDPMWVSGNAGGSCCIATTGGPETHYAYDWAGRQILVAQYANQTTQVTRGGVAMQTTTAYNDVNTVVTPPAPAGSTTSQLDSFGRTWRLDKAGPNGTQSTTYRYDTHDNLMEIDDPTGKPTTYTYDSLGRRLTANDPNTGASSVTYDNNGNPTATTDAKGQTIVTTYDAFNRKTAVYAGSISGTKLFGYAYDTAAGGIGKLASQTAYSNGNAYTQTIASYDVQGRPTGSSWVVPSAEGALAGTYTESVGYDLAGHQTTLTYPAAGGLPAETVTSAYNNLGLPTTVTGAATYVAATTFNGLGQLTGRTLGSGTGSVTRSYAYETDTRALSNLRATVSTSAGTITVQDDTYGRNAAGEVTSLTDNVNGQAQCFSYDALARMTRAFTTTAANACATANHTFTPAPGETAYDTSYAYTAPARTVGASGTGSPTYAGRVGVLAKYPNVATVSDDITVTRASTAGNTLIVSMYLSSANSTPSSVTDSQGNTYTVAAEHLDSDSHRIEVLVAANAKALSTSDKITITFPTATKYQATVDEFAGVASVSPVDKATTATGPAGGTTFATAGVTTTAANELLFAATGTNSGTIATYDAGWNTLTGTALSSYKLTPAWRPVTATGAYAATGTTTSEWQTALVTLKGSSQTTQTLPAVVDGQNALATVADNITGTSTQYGYTDGAHEHAPTVVGASTFTYDANGNQTSRSVAGTATVLAWTPTGQLASLTTTGGTTSDVYAADGSRLIRHDPGTGKAVLFIGGEELALNGSTVTATRYYAAQNGATVAQRTPTTLTWLLGDAQGTATVAVNATTGAATRQYYTPYGNQRGGQVLQSTTDRAFLGHVEDYGVGLVQDGARYYDPATGTFISPDPVNDGKPAQLNAYAYAGNNPATMSDPSGLKTKAEKEAESTTGDNATEQHFCDGCEELPKPEPTCPSGYHYNGHGCGENPKPTCQVGYHYNGHGCGKDAITVVNPDTVRAAFAALGEPLYDSYSNSVTMPGFVVGQPGSTPLTCRQLAVDYCSLSDEVQVGMASCADFNAEMCWVGVASDSAEFQEQKSAARFGFPPMKEMAELGEITGGIVIGLSAACEVASLGACTPLAAPAMMMGSGLLAGAAGAHGVMAVQACMGDSEESCGKQIGFVGADLGGGYAAYAHASGAIHGLLEIAEP
jgi:RHS repeat-associated protein